MSPKLLPQLLPFKPIKPYIRPDNRENKAMTVVVGLMCLDGVVLCADQPFDLLYTAI